MELDWPQCGLLGKLHLRCRGKTGSPRYARNVWKIAESEDRKAAEAGIQATEGFFAGLGMPISVSQLIGRKMTQEEITKLARKCTFGGSAR